MNSNNLKFLNKDNKILLVRSAFLGDFAVCLPFIYFLINDIGIKEDNIHIIIVNNNGSNPLSIILGSQSILYKNSIVLKTNNYFESIINLKKIARELTSFTVLYLPFRFETNFQKLKKFLFLKLGLGIFAQINGLSFRKNDRSNSQYTHLFDLFGATFSNKDYKRLFEIGNYELPAFSKTNITIYPNSKLKMKIWPIEYYISLIEKLSSINKGVKIFLIGGKDDYEYNQRIINSTNSNTITNIAGKYLIPQLFSVFNNIDLFIGNDGFPMHIAALAGTPIVGIFTYKERIGVWDPVITKKMVTIRTDVGCKECSKIECSNPVCITSVTVQDVLDESLFILTSNTDRISKIIVKPSLNYLTFRDNV